MIDENLYRTILWNPNEGEDSDFAKKAILEILKSQKVSLSKVRYLFNAILDICDSISLSSQANILFCFTYSIVNSFANNILLSVIIVSSIL